MSYRHKAPIQLRFADTDMLGHVNNANFLTYMELARMSYFNEVLAGVVDWTKEGIILAKAIIDYKRPVFLEDKIYIFVRVNQISSRSFNMQYIFVKDKGHEETVAAEGSTLMVCYDYQANKSIVMPDLWRSRITAYEGLPTNHPTS